MDVADVRQDLIAEQDALDAALANVEMERFSTVTASPGWTIADQIAHLAYFDFTASVAISDPEQFQLLVAEMWRAAGEGADALDAYTMGRYRVMGSSELLDEWRAERSRLAAASATLRNDDRVEWYGPSMGSKSFLTARLMECWAHGQDIVDALGVSMPVTDRLVHIARLGFITRGWSYLNRGLEAPTDEVRVTLGSPSGGSWEFGSADTTESVEGSAFDFCRVVTQRTHLDDTELQATPAAREWLLIAQAFAGPPTDGPAPAQ